MKPTYRASEMARGLACPGSAQVVARVRRFNRLDGDEGTMVHYKIAETLIRDHGAIAPDGGIPHPQVAPGYALPQSSEWMVDWGVRHVLETVPADWALM